MSTGSASAQLRRLAEVLANENTKLEQQATAARDAQAEVAATYDALVQAEAEENKVAIKATEKAWNDAKATADREEVRLKGARLRVDRARREFDQFKAAHTEDLIAEEEPEAHAISDEMADLARKLTALDQRYSALHGRVTHLVGLTPGGVVHEDMPPGDHALTAAIRLLIPVAEGFEQVRPPLPTWAHRKRIEAHNRTMAAQAKQRDANTNKQPTGAPS